MKKPFFIIFLLLTFASCDKSDHVPKDLQPYTGPLREAENIELYYSESATVKVKLTAKKMLEFANGNQEFPEGLYMEFFNEAGKMTSTLRANEAIYTKEQDVWRGRGDVEIKSIENNQQLNTEELFWKPDQERMYTDKFVTIKLPDQVLYGRGLTAKQDFSSYEITEPEGIFYLEDE
ncbi:LPS export ABC transporter periplasmic protein LptC [Fulvivirga imtechensis]|uniref:LPS export ABC transporter periplasmic protein LptC n=1 Tax=Fulvivirga imtechensis TaxID=881893 RepID=UPI0002F2A269|nr:LPS export ABC transporter periplasmic protein LptC [Fulvivirga imtechensis]